jgi:pimeloyl-ACP methyl ester carboxylesterase
MPAASAPASREGVRPDDEPVNLGEVAWLAFDAGRYGTHLLPPRQHVATPWGDVAVRDTGPSGAGAVVAVHGWGADGLLNWFTAVGPLAAAGWRVVAVDLPGHGATSPHGPFTLAAAAECVAAVADTLGVSQTSAASAAPGQDAAAPCVAVGYSMGGPVTQLWARQHPGAVGRLVQVVTAAHIIPSTVNSRVVAGLARVGGIATGAVDTLSRLGMGAGDGRTLGGHAAITARRASKRVLLAAAGELARYDARAWVGDIDADWVCVVADGDQTVPPAAQRELAELTGAATIAVDAGHTVCLAPGFGDLLCHAVAAPPGSHEVWPASRLGAGGEPPRE